MDDDAAEWDAIARGFAVMTGAAGQSQATTGPPSANSGQKDWAAIGKEFEEVLGDAGPLSPWSGFDDDDVEEA